MRVSFTAIALSAILLATVVSGCATAKSTAPEPPKPTLTLIVEP